MTRMGDRVRVEYLFSRACPSHEEGLERLAAAAARAEVELDLVVTEILSDEEAAARRFPGSPTYLVEGTDMVDPPVGVPFSVDACRAYRDPSGRIGPLPHPDDLAAALTAPA